MSKVKRAFFLPLLGAILGAGVLVWVARTFPVMGYISQAQHTVAGWGWLGVLLYPLLFGACNVLLLPAGTLALGSGLFFGLWKGFAVNVLGNLLGAWGAMLLSRRFGRDFLRRRLLRHPKWQALDDSVAREGWKIIFLTQLLPFAPSSLLNYLFGVTKVPLRTALLWSALGQVPTMFVYAYIGTLAGFGLQILRGSRQTGWVEPTLWSGGLLVTLLAAWLLGRLALRLLAETQGKMPERKAPPPVPLPLGTDLTPTLLTRPTDVLRSQQAPI